MAVEYFYLLSSFRQSTGKKPTTLISTTSLSSRSSKTSHDHSLSLNCHYSYAYLNLTAQPAIMRCKLAKETLNNVWNMFKENSTLIQIWKSSYMFVFIYKWYLENSAFSILRILKLFVRKVFEMFVYKHKTMEYVKK